MRSVVLVELPTYENILPLASGYLQAMAAHDPEVGPAYSFRIVSRPVSLPREEILAGLLELDADVYTFSCYIWNMRLVRWLLDRLRQERPESRFLLGGPQVMNHAATYLADKPENVYVCNGEGEHTFVELLRRLAADTRELSAVPGLSYWHDSDLRTTLPAPRIKDLMEIPSPFLTGVFDDQSYSFAIMETNRGCPFSCSFCYWGAATNDKVHKFEGDRIKDELTWISEHGATGIFIADANWGLSPRDVELTHHIVECGKRTGYPLVVHMAAAKNKPERMAEITEIFVKGGMMVTQPISLQTLDAGTLATVDRQNIRKETYISLQQQLRDKQISSYVELIWPLPGETYESFKDGLTSLCRSYADTIIVYPQLLLHNTPMHSQRELHGLVTEEVPSEVAEAEVVVGTRWVSREECRQGYWLNYAVHSLYNMRALFLLSGYLDATGVIAYGDFFADVARYFQSRTDNEVCRFFAESTAQLANYDLLNSGKTAHFTLSSLRSEFDALLADYVRAQPWWEDPLAREAFELDLLSRPYIYREPFRAPEYDFTEAVVKGTDDKQSVLVEVSAPMTRLLTDRELLPAGADSADARTTVRIDHRARQKMPYMPQRSLEHNANYCQGMVLRFREVLPTWRVVEG
ncbi:radical SAM superfamily enzyme YgiQ (UPF0313 family) [Catenulispora sp. GP43]|uniref:B12-binding domain-containing radical SAM protein n=1 Tax=Catenulispora sp. GP43 TaxID=3156263 RepID=UPI003517032D